MAVLCLMTILITLMFIDMTGRERVCCVCVCVCGCMCACVFQFSSVREPFEMEMSFMLSTSWSFVCPDLWIILFHLSCLFNHQTNEFRFPATIISKSFAICNSVISQSVYVNLSTASFL